MLLATADEVLLRRHGLPARVVCKLIGQIVSMQLALGLVCRLRSRYLLLAVRGAAVAANYNITVVITGRALDELMLWRDKLTKLPEAPMHGHLRLPDFTLECDASDHALGAILVHAPRELRQHLWGFKTYRRLLPNETAWGSLLRELTGYRDAVRALARRTPLAGKMVSVVGDARSATYIFAKGGSQVVDKETGCLLITEVLLDILNDADDAGYDVAFRWVRREEIQDADDLSKFVDTMDFSLEPKCLAHVLNTYGPVHVDAFAAPHNAVCARFFARFDATTVEATDALAQDWSQDVMFVLPDFHQIDAILDRIERDNAEAVLIVPVWTSKPWWKRLWSGSWSGRRGRHEVLEGSVLTPNNEHCFFGQRFNARLLVLRTTRANVCHT
jgi:hypothetical protein